MRCTRAQARPEEAQKAYLAAIDADPKQSIAYNNLAWLAAERKTRLDDALTWAKKAIELEPKVPQFQDTLGWVHRARGELDKAADVLQKATKIEPQQAVIWYHLGHHPGRTEENQGRRRLEAGPANPAELS